MAKSRSRCLFSRLQLYSRSGNGADCMKILDMVPFGPHSAVRVHPPSFGVIRIRTSRYLGTTFSGCDGTVECWQLTNGRLLRCYSRYVQLKWSDFTFSSHFYQRPHQTKGDKNRHLWTERKPRAPEFDHKMTKKALWVDIWSNPASVKARLKLTSQGRLQSRASYGTRNLSQDTSQGNRFANDGKTYTVSTNATELNHVVKNGVGSMHMHSAKTTSEAIAILKNRLQRGITTGSYTFVKLLQMCLKQKDLAAAKQVHDCIIERGMDTNQYVANALLNVYIRSGRLLDARRVFDGFKKRDVVTWTMMITGYAKNDHAESALELFNRMRQEGVLPDAVTYLSILRACASPLALKWGKEVHACIRHAGLESDVRVGNALLQMYTKCGCITEARQFFEKLTNRDSITWSVMIGAYAASGNMGDAQLIFDRMKKRHVITWNIIIGAYAERGRGIEAYRLFLQMRREGFEPDAITYMNILNASASAGALEWVKEVHGHASKAGLESDLRVGNALVHMYAKSGSIDDARQVFERMEKRDIITWNTMIGGLAQHGCGHEALELFRKMNANHVKPDGTSFVAVLSACCHAGLLDEGRKLFLAMTHDYGIEPDIVHYTCMVDLLGRAGQLEEAKLFMTDMPVEPNVVAWSVLIGAYAECGRGVEAYQLFLQMRREGFEPDAITYMNILNTSASAGALEWVKEVHGHASKAGLESDLRVGNALVNMYAKSGSIDDARLVFDRMEKRDIITWNTMIGGLGQHGCGHEALELFRKMNADRVKPDGTSFVAVLSACCHAGLLDDGRRLFLAMTHNYGIEPDVVHYTCMVDLLGRAGQLEEAKLFITDMPVEPDGVTWRALLGACRTYGDVELGELAAETLFKLEPNNASAYVLLSNIYAAAGKREKVSLVRTMMHERGVRKEPGRSWIQVDNEIHDFVVGDISHTEAKEIYSQLNELTEKLKAEGYVPDTQLVSQNIDEVDKELALCSHSEKLAITYGVMRIPQGTPIRVYKNLRVCSDCHTATKFISKVTGREIIAKDPYRFHHFKDGVCSCGDYW